MAARSMPNRVATFSAVWPIDSPTTGSVRPEQADDGRQVAQRSGSADELGPGRARRTSRTASAPCRPRTAAARGQRVHAAGHHQLRTARLDVGDGRVQRLHARGAVAHHGPARHAVAAAQAQRDHAADVDFVGRGRGAADDDLVHVGGREGLAAAARARPARPGRPPKTGRGPRAFRKGVRDPSTTYTGLNAIRASLVLMRPGARRRTDRARAKIEGEIVHLDHGVAQGVSALDHGVFLVGQAAGRIGGVGDVAHVGLRIAVQRAALSSSRILASMGSASSVAASASSMAPTGSSAVAGRWQPAVRRSRAAPG